MIGKMGHHVFLLDEDRQTAHHMHNALCDINHQSTNNNIRTPCRTSHHKGKPISCESPPTSLHGCINEQNALELDIEISVNELKTLLNAMPSMHCFVIHPNQNNN